MINPKSQLPGSLEQEKIQYRNFSIPQQISPQKSPEKAAKKNLHVSFKTSEEVNYGITIKGHSSTPNYPSHQLNESGHLTSPRQQVEDSWRMKYYTDLNLQSSNSKEDPTYRPISASAPIPIPRSFDGINSDDDDDGEFIPPHLLSRRRYEKTLMSVPQPRRVTASYFERPRTQRSKSMGCEDDAHVSEWI